jgi:hypothetical protein
MFHRICAKAGLNHKKGWGWHMLRHSLVTLFDALLPVNRLSPTLLADYSGWRRKSSAKHFDNVEMIAEYRRPEILYTDPFGVDKVIYDIHPFLPLWKEKPAGKVQVKD